MTQTALLTTLPPASAVKEQIVALESELQAMRRLLRAARAAEQATEARKRRQSLQQTQAGGLCNAS
jgi:hypothetical protein